jgi:hypothetical protein
MRKITLTILLACASNAEAQIWDEYNPIDQPSRPSRYGLGQVVPVSPPFGPALPIPNGQVNSAGWQTGYSVVTETKNRPNPWLSRQYGREVRDETTVTTIVPNNALGQPMIFNNPFD